MSIKTLGSLGKIRVGRVTGNTHIFFFGLMKCLSSKMVESRSIVFGLSFSDKIKCIQQFKHVLIMNFKNLENVIF